MTSRSRVGLLSTSTSLAGSEGSINPDSHGLQIKLGAISGVASPARIGDDRIDGRRAEDVVGLAIMQDLQLRGLRVDAIGVDAALAARDGQVMARVAVLPSAGMVTATKHEVERGCLVVGGDAGPESGDRKKKGNRCQSHGAGLGKAVDHRVLEDGKDRWNMLVLPGSLSVQTHKV